MEKSRWQARNEMTASLAEFKLVKRRIDTSDRDFCDLFVQGLVNP